MNQKLYRIIQLTFFLFLVSTLFSNYIAFRWVLTSLNSQVDYGWFKFNEDEAEWAGYNMLDFFDPVGLLWCGLIAFIHVQIESTGLNKTRGYWKRHLIDSAVLSCIFIIISFVSHIIGFSTWLEVYIDVLWSGLFVFVAHLLVFFGSTSFVKIHKSGHEVMRG